MAWDLITENIKDDNDVLELKRYKLLKLLLKVKKKIQALCKTIIMQDWVICRLYYMVLCWHKLAQTAKLSLTQSGFTMTFVTAEIEKTQQMQRCSLHILINDVLFNDSTKRSHIRLVYGWFYSPLVRKRRSKLLFYFLLFLTRLSCLAKQCQCTSLWQRLTHQDQKTGSSLFLFHCQRLQVARPLPLLFR